MSGTVTVDVTQGTLRGRKTSSKFGRTYYSFEGIQYAKPPVGPLRFKVPEPPQPWFGVRDALKPGNSCTQFGFDTKRLEGSEDCLYLNVYTPKLPASGSADVLLPVMVWIHGGGFTFGSGNPNGYGPDYLVDEGVVIVNINFRLGALGFLCLDEPCAPGNMGLKDQVAALRWVQKNIAKFGGDPSNVTIFGESSGAMSVHLHMFSPMSKGLFHRAIAQSGIATHARVIDKRCREKGFRLGKALGFSGKAAEDLVEFLRSVDHTVLVKAANEHVLTQEDKERLVAFPFYPTLEVEVEGIERFLPGDPVKLFLEGCYHDVPFITGITDREGILVFKFADFKKEETISRIDKNLGSIILPHLRLPKDCSNTDQVISKVRHFYFKDKPLSEETLPEFVDMYTDIMYAEGMDFMVKKMIELSKSPVYLYKFSFDGKLNFFKKSTGVTFAGASHADDISYLFYSPFTDPNLTPTSPEEQTRTRMVKLWTNFAKTGNPTPEADPKLSVTWEPVTIDNPYYLEINEELSLSKHLLKERIQFWEDLYKNL